METAVGNTLLSLFEVKYWVQLQILPKPRPASPPEKTDTSLPFEKGRRSRRYEQEGFRENLLGDGFEP